MQITILAPTKATKCTEVGTRTPCCATYPNNDVGLVPLGIISMGSLINNQNLSIQYFNSHIQSEKGAMRVYGSQR